MDVANAGRIFVIATTCHLPPTIINDFTLVNIANVHHNGSSAYSL